ITSLKWLETNNLFNNLIQRNQSAAFSSGKVRPNHETNINIIARRTGKDVNSHTVLDGIITTIDRKSGSAGMPRPISYAVFCLKKKNAGRLGLVRSAVRGGCGVVVHSALRPD